MPFLFSLHYKDFSLCAWYWQTSFYICWNLTVVNYRRTLTKAAFLLLTENMNKAGQIISTWLIVVYSAVLYSWCVCVYSFIFWHLRLSLFKFVQLHICPSLFVLAFVSVHTWELGVIFMQVTWNRSFYSRSVQPLHALTSLFCFCFCLNRNCIRNLTLLNK